uniref:Chemokine interleukin-8-like domain-containing protein n=1 Tax=Oryzias melastigma TaxID=30732 RepID=A0A3B3CL78_ORYME
HSKSTGRLTCWSHAGNHDVEESPYCCVEFSSVRLPLSRVKNIKKTARSCPVQGFIVETRTKRICLSKSSPWSQQIFNRFHNLTNTADEDAQR